MVDQNNTQPDNFQDYFWQHSTLGQALGAFGQGADQGWGSGEEVNSQLTADLTKAGVYNDYNKDRISGLKAMNEAWMRPSIAALSAGWGGVNAFLGSLSQGTENIAYQVGGREAVGIVESEFARGMAGSRLTPLEPHIAPEVIQEAGQEGFRQRFMDKIHQTGEPTTEHLAQEIADHRDAQALTPEQRFFNTINQARANAVIGETDDTYFGLKNPTPQQLIEREKAANSIDQPLDIHALARSIAPEQYDEYTDLLNNRNHIEESLMRLSESKKPEATPEQSTEALQLAEAINKKFNIPTEEPQIGGAPQATNLAEGINQRFNADLLTRNLEGALNGVNKRLRELAPDIQFSYEAAQEAYPKAAEAITNGEDPVEYLQRTKATRPTSIASTVTKRLTDKGRPFEEAYGIGALVQAHYEARASRFVFNEGLKTQEALFKDEFPEIETTNKKNRRGGLEINEMGKNILRLSEKADASTFIHEIGHDWLEELGRDAVHPEVNEQTRTDYQTVKDWLGVKEGEEISRRQHEKFARGFERYLMEGVSPSKGLVRVFNQFKEWLTKIYNTVANLKSPINDDIRDVFDRLLAANPQKVIIAEDRSLEAPTAKIESAEGNPKTIGTEIPSQEKTSVGLSDELSVKPVNKAGNINLDKVTDDESLQTIIKQVAQEHRDFIGTRRGTVSWDETISTAEAAGMTPMDMDQGWMSYLRNLTVNADVPLSSATYAVKLYMLQAAKDVKQAIKDEDQFSYLQARQRLIYSAQTFAGTTAEAGRTLNILKTEYESAAEAGNLNEYLQANFSLNVKQLKQQMAALQNLQTASQVNNLVLNSAKPSLGQMLLELLRNNLISGPITHMVYHEGNEAFSLYKAVPESFTKALVSKVHDIFDPAKPEERIRAEEGLIGFKTFLYSQWDGVKTAVDAAKAGKAMGLPDEKGAYDIAYEKARKEGLYPNTPQFDAKVQQYRDNYIDQLAKDQVKSQGLTGQAAAQQIATLKANPPPAWIHGTGQAAATLFSRPKAIPGILGVAARIPGERMVAPIHSMNRHINYVVTRDQLIYRKALNEGLKFGTQAFDTRVALLKKDVPEDIMAQAREEATEAALMSRGGEWTRLASKFLNYEFDLPGLGKTAPGSFIDPFITIPATIIRLSLRDRSPLGLFSKQIREELSGNKGRIAQDTAIAKIGLGTAVMGASMGMVASGMLIGAPPTDPKEATVMLASGYMPYSLRIGDMSFQLNRLGVPGSMFAYAADIYSMGKLIGKEGFNRESLEDATFAGVSSIGQHFMQEGIASGFSDAMKAVSDPGRYGKNYLDQFVSNFTPYAIGQQQLNNWLLDPYQRQTRNFIESERAKLLGFSIFNPEKIDVFGQPIPNKEYYGVYAEHIQNDPIIHMMQQAGYFPAPVQRSIRGVRLTDEQWTQYAIHSGIGAKGLLDNLTQSDYFEHLNPQLQHEIVKKAFSESRQGASAWMLMNYPDIRDQALKNKEMIVKGQ